MTRHRIYDRGQKKRDKLDHRVHRGPQRKNAACKTLCPLLWALSARAVGLGFVIVEVQVVFFSFIWKQKWGTAAKSRLLAFDDRRMIVATSS